MNSNIKILNKTLIGKNKWLVKYEHWPKGGCYCSKKTASIEIEADKRPGLRELRVSHSR